MIAEAFGFVQFPILPLVKLTDEEGVQLFRTNPRLCTPNYFDYSPYFKIIKYPFINFSMHHTYRLLPWKGSTELTGQESQMYLNPEEQTSRAEVEEAISLAVQNTEHEEEAGTDTDADQESANDDTEEQPRLLN